MCALAASGAANPSTHTARDGGKLPGLCAARLRERWPSRLKGADAVWLDLLLDLLYIRDLQPEKKHNQTRLNCLLQYETSIVDIKTKKNVQRVWQRPSPTNPRPTPHDEMLPTLRGCIRARGGCQG